MAANNNTYCELVLANWPEPAFGRGKPNIFISIANAHQIPLNKFDRSVHQTLHLRTEHIHNKI